MLRTVKLLALVAMFFVALTASAQVTTSALSGVVTDENQQAMIGATITALHTPSSAHFFPMKSMDGDCSIQDKFYDLSSFLNNITSENQPEDGSLIVISWPLFLFCVIVVLGIFRVLTVAIINGENIRIKYSKFNIEIGTKKERKKERKKENKR